MEEIVIMWWVVKKTINKFIFQEVLVMEHTLIRVMVRLSGVAWNHLIEDTMQLWSTAHRNSALKYISLRKHQIGLKEMVEKMRRR